MTALLVWRVQCDWPEGRCCYRNGTPVGPADSDRFRQRNGPTSEELVEIKKLKSRVGAVPSGIVEVVNGILKQALNLDARESGNRQS